MRLSQLILLWVCVAPLVLIFLHAILCLMFGPGFPGYKLWF